MSWEGVAVVITAFGTIIGLFLNFRQHAYNKEKEYELKKREEDDRLQRERLAQENREGRNELKKAAQVIYRELNRVINSTDALRAYIIQPHPLDKAKYISVQYEVLAAGVTSVVENVQRMPIGNVGGFVAELSSRDFLFWNAERDVRDGRARAMMHNFGTDRMAAMRMMDGEVWLGNLVLDFDLMRDLEVVWLKEKMGEAAHIIKYKLPEIDE